MEKREFEVKGMIRKGQQTYVKYFIPAKKCTGIKCDFAYTGGCVDTTCIKHACNEMLMDEILNEWKDMKEEVV